MAAFGRWVLRPRMLVDVSQTTAARSILGAEVSFPVLVAPMAFQGLAHPDGEQAMARGAAAAETIMCQSTLSTVGLEEVAEAAPGGARWFQLYWGPDRTKVQDLLGRAAAAGYKAIVVTVDLPEVGRRERDLRTGFETPASLSDVTDNSLTWRDLEWLRAETALPVLVKGILTAEDAVLAIEAGVEGVVVSNHGGRQLDGVAASLDALPEVVEAVGDRAEVLLDGARRPAWTYRWFRGADVTFANLVDVVPGGVAEIAAFVDRELGAASATWDDLDRLRRRWDGPLVVKGILSVDDALEAVRRGADAVYVSNHGGRQLDGSPATLDVLPRIAEAVGDRAEVLLDGGVRRGEDAVKARALGARAVLAGRPWFHALAAGGEAVLTRQLGLLRDGVDRTLALLGVPRLDDVGPGSLVSHDLAPNDRSVDTSARR